MDDSEVEPFEVACDQTECSVFSGRWNVPHLSKEGVHFEINLEAKIAFRSLGDGFIQF